MFDSGEWCGLALKPRHRSTREAFPESFSLRLRFQGPENAERRLAAAILEDAIRCFQESFPALDYENWLLHWETDAWINGQDGDQLFSFRNVCAIVKVDPGFVRRSLYRWRERRLAFGGPRRSATDWGTSSSTWRKAVLPEARSV